LRCQVDVSLQIFSILTLAVIADNHFEEVDVELFVIEYFVNYLWRLRVGDSANRPCFTEVLHERPPRPDHRELHLDFDRVVAVTAWDCDRVLKFMDLWV